MRQWICASLTVLCVFLLAGCAAAPEDAVPYSEEAVYAFLEEAVLDHCDQTAVYFQSEEDGLTADMVDAVMNKALELDGVLNYYVAEYSWTSRPVGQDCVKLTVDFTYAATAAWFDEIPESESPHMAVHAVIQALNDGQFEIPIRVAGEGWSEAEVEMLISAATDNADCPSTFYCSYYLTPAAGAPRQFLVLLFKPTVDEATYVEYKAAMDAELDAMAEDILSQELTEDADLYRAAHDAVLDAVEYNMALASSFAGAEFTSADMGPDYTAYGAVVMGATVCYGYAMAYKLLCDRLNLPCWTVAGTADGEAHQWNVVYLDGEEYLVDCTWDDAARDRYRYFLCTPELASHQAVEGWVYGW